MTKTAVKLSDLKQDQNNANKGTERGRYMVAHSLEQFGAGRSILLDKHNNIIAGNKTTEAAADLGIDDVIIVETDGTKLVAVKRTDLDLSNGDDRARLMAYADNRASEVGLEWDIDAILGDLSEGVDLSGMFKDDEIKELLGDLEQPSEEDAEPQMSRADELRDEWGVESGQVWRLASRDGKGEHRVICGDCTDGDVVGAVMGGETVGLVLTDPPYGIGLNTDYFSSRRKTVNERKKSSDTYTRNHAWHAKTHPAIVGDDKNFDPSFLLDFPRIMLWGANNYAQELPSKYSWLVWDKKTERGAKTGFSDCELCWCSGLSFESVRIFRHMWAGYQRDSEVGEGSFHPTQKPVKLFEWCLSFAPKDKIVSDFYLGAGASLIACENLNRYCRAVEISPAYVAVALQRYKDAFDITAELVTGTKDTL